jgi:mannose-6-phosphate isomerase-like protein (cupin superfamily)
MKKGYKENIENLTRENNYFRKVLYTGQNLQLVLMSLKPLEEIGFETHYDNDQFFRFESGNGKVIINYSEYEVGDGDVVIIPAGSQHNIINTSEGQDLKMYTIYTPPHHKDKIERVTKKEAEQNEEDFDGVTTE